MSKDAPLIPAASSARLVHHGPGKWHNTYDRNLHSAADNGGWPLQRGFDRFYGFMGAETSYYQPDRMLEGNQLAQVDGYPDGYFAPDDYTSRAITWMAENRASAPDKPFFLPGLPVTPYARQAKPEDQARYRGVYDAGWDALRLARFERQRAMGLIEPNAVLPPRNPGVPEWASSCRSAGAVRAVHGVLCGSGGQRRIKTSAACWNSWKRRGQLDNTLIMITSDNGANSIGGPTGVMNLQDRRQGLPKMPHWCAGWWKPTKSATISPMPPTPAAGRRCPTHRTASTSARPWPAASGCLCWSHWPDGIADKGGLRPQWIHVTDVLPTLLELTGGTYPPVCNGYRTRSMDGKSFAASLRQADAPAQRQRQHYAAG